jgi:hypothetical protein
MFSPTNIEEMTKTIEFKKINVAFFKADDFFSSKFPDIFIRIECYSLRSNRISLLAQLNKNIQLVSKLLFV